MYSIEDELVFKFARSSGPGGQNVNKLNTKVELRWELAASKYFSEAEKAKLRRRLNSYITKSGILVLQEQSTRSQLKNKEQAIQKLYKLINGALREQKKRVPTKPTRSSVQKRLENKKMISLKKQQRRKLD